MWIEQWSPVLILIVFAFLIHLKSIRKWINDRIHVLRLLWLGGDVISCDRNRNGLGLITRTPFKLEIGKTMKLRDIEEERVLNFEVRWTREFIFLGKTFQRIGLRNI